MEYKNLDVFVLTYNRAEYLRVMLESLCTQTAKGFNIKVLNNCSTDNTLEVIEEIKKKYPDRNISVITNEKNLGNPGNFKRSQELAENEYTAIFHDDDAIHPEYIETAMKLFDKHKDAVMCCCSSDVKYNINNENWDCMDKSYYLFPVKNNTYFQLLVSRPNFATDIYKTEAYKKASYRPDLYGKCHDICFILDICQIGSIINLLGYGIRYRIHGGSDSQNYATGPFPREIANVLAYLKQMMKGHILSQPLLWNFAFFLYKWSKINKYMAWKKFSKISAEKDCVRLFSPIERKIFSNLFLINTLNKLIRARANYYRRKLYNANDE